MPRARQVDREANAAYMRAYRARKRAESGQVTAPREPPPHGTIARYQRYKCHCAECRIVNRDRMRVYRTGDPGPGHNLARSPYDTVIDDEMKEIVDDPER